MAGASTVHGAQPVEYAEETTFGSTAAADLELAYNWFGLVSSFSVTEGVEVDSVRYLPGDGNGGSLQNVKNVKVSEAWEAEGTWSVQDLTEVQYWTGTTGGLNSDLTSLTIGEQDEENGQYRNITGCVGEELTLTIEEDSIAEFSGSFLGADATDWSTTDYTGTGGSHATADTTDPLTFDDLANVTYGGAALSDYIESLTLTISNDLEAVKDPDAGTSSQIAAIVPTSREISVELGLTYDDFSLAQTVRSYVKQSFGFDFGPNNETWTVNGTAFPEFPYEYGAEDLIGDSLSSDPCTDLSWV